MVNAFLTEFLKLRRSKMLLFVILAGLIPALVRFMQYAFSVSNKAVGWEWFIASNREIVVFSVLVSVVLVSGFIFSMEYQYNTASYIFTSSISRIKIFIAKMLSLFAVITLLLVVSAFSDLLFGFLALKEGLPPNLMLKFITVIGWYIFSYCLFSTTVVMLVVLLKRFVLSAVVVLGYLMLVFPIHLKGNPYICPFMAPTIIASKLFNSNNYIFTNYYKDMSIDYFGITAFLIVIAAISLMIGIANYKRPSAR